MQVPESDNKKYIKKINVYDMTLKISTNCYEAHLKYFYTLALLSLLPGAL